MKSKNKSPFSRFLALMLAFVMTFTMMPATASAAGQSSSREGTGGGTEDPMHYEKTTTLGDDGTYTIRMETYATGTVTTSTNQKPTDIVLVLDVSGSMEEDDFLSAEIEVVPAGPARDCGLDRSMIAGYGHDDRVCAFPSFQAMIETEAPERTSCCILVDKEEIGSVGATGMESRFFENTTAEVMNAAGQYSELSLRRALKNSMMLSSDVSAAFDPNYPEVMEKKNSAYLGHGITFNKYTGSRGKSGSNDANPEYIAKLRKVMEENHVAFQTAELGKVDQGGGGTIAYILANYDMEVIDCGVAVLNMHAPWEIASKVDIYEAYRGYCVFLKEM